MTLPEFLSALSQVHKVQRELKPKTEKEIVVEMAMEQAEEAAALQRRRKWLNERESG